MHWAGKSPLKPIRRTKARSRPLLPCCALSNATLLPSKKTGSHYICVTNIFETQSLEMCHTLTSRWWLFWQLRLLGSALFLLILCLLHWAIRGALKIHFRKKLGFWPNKGEGGLTEAQVFIEIFQKQICLGKWPEMWWNTQYINGGAISFQFMRVLDPPIPNYSLSQPKKWNFSWKNNMLRIA